MISFEFYFVFSDENLCLYVTLIKIFDVVTNFITQIWSNRVRPSSVGVQLIMRYLTLTSDCSKFDCDTVGDQLVLKWNTFYDFTNIGFIGISSISFHGFKPNTKHDRLVPIYSNLISRTIMNPKRNILNLRITRNSHVAQCQLNMSEYTCTNKNWHFIQVLLTSVSIKWIKSF